MKDSNVDVIISPNNFEREPPLVDSIMNSQGDSHEASIDEYKMDYFTALANCLGVPALTMPVRPTFLSQSDFPSSVRLQGFFGEDRHVLAIGREIEKILV